MTTLKEKLEAIIKEDKGTIREDVAATATKYGESDEEIKSFFKDLASSGCSSGMISHLIYYTDTAKYFSEHEDEIEDIKQDFKEETGETLKIERPMTNWLSWFAFEETGRKIASELDLDI